MDWTWYLFRFEGRINRAKLWLAMPVILGWMMFLAGLTLATGDDALDLLGCGQRAIGAFGVRAAGQHVHLRARLRRETGR